MNVGLIGLGFMGTLMGRALLAAGYELTVFDIDPARCAELEHAGAVTAGSASALASGRDIVFMMVREPSQVRECVAGPDGILSADSLPRIVVDCSTNSHALVLSLAGECASRGVAFVDAPVTGRPPDATFFVGGDPVAVAELQPLFAVLANHVTHLGGPGCGTVGKLVNQQVLYGTYLISLEALLMAAKAGVDAPLLAQAMQHGPARSAVLDSIPEKILGADLSDNRGAPLRLIDKDMRLLAELAAGLEMSSANVAALVEAFGEALAEGLGDHHFGAVVQVLADRRTHAVVSNDRQLVRRFVELWNADTPELLGEVADASFIWHGIDGGEVHGLDAYVKTVTARSRGPRHIVIEQFAGEAVSSWSGYSFTAVTAADSARTTSSRQGVER